MHIFYYPHTQQINNMSSLMRHFHCLLTGPELGPGDNHVLCWCHLHPGRHTLHSLGHTLSLSSSSCSSCLPRAGKVFVSPSSCLSVTLGLLHAGISPYLYRYEGGGGAREPGHICISTHPGYIYISTHPGYIYISTHPGYICTAEYLQIHIQM